MTSITSDGTVTLKKPSIPYGILNGKRFYLLNFLSELDQEGEYVIIDDMVYVIPPEPLVNYDDLILSVTDQIFTISSNAHQFHNLQLEMCRGIAISLSPGLNYIVVNNTVISNTGNVGINMSDCMYGCKILNCTMYEMGHGGCIVSGGNRNLLQATDFLIMNNTIFNFTRIGKTYRPALSIGGVGVTVTHNVMHTASHSAIIHRGNNFEISFNEIYDVCKAMGDAGAIYSGRDW